MTEPLPERVSQATVAETASLRDVLGVLDRTGIKLALVIDGNRKLTGTVSDGDVRRALIKGVDLDSPVAAYCNRDFRSVRAGSSDAEILEHMKWHHLHQMPVIDAEGRLTDLKLIDELIQAPDRDNLVVIMAGGLGTRLGELTRETPKPMLPIGGRPLLENLIRTLRDQGFHRFRLAVNYRAEVIEAHFGDGARFGCEVRYIRETKRLGTAGALSLISEPNDLPVIVANGDLVLQASIAAMLDHHEKCGASATMAVRNYEYQVPYGVIRTQEGRVISIDEKPREQHLIAAGLYVLSEDARRIVPGDVFYDMPQLFSEIVRHGDHATVYPIEGYWADIGQAEDYARAQDDHGK